MNVSLIMSLDVYFVQPSSSKKKRITRKKGANASAVRANASASLGASASQDNELWHGEEAMRKTAYQTDSADDEQSRQQDTHTLWTGLLKISKRCWTVS